AEAASPSPERGAAPPAPRRGPRARVRGSTSPCGRAGRLPLARGLLRLVPSCRLDLEAREAFDEPRRRAVLDCRPRALDAFARVADLARDLERERGAERERVTVRGRVLAGERGLEPLCILGRVAADERLGRARLDAVIRRIA